jgi:hypothetical protein
MADKQEVPGAAAEASRKRDEADQAQASLATAAEGTSPPVATNPQPWIRNVGPHEHSWVPLEVTTNGAFEECGACGTRRFTGVGTTHGAYGEWLTGGEWPGEQGVAGAGVRLQDPLQSPDAQVAAAARGEGVRAPTEAELEAATVSDQVKDAARAASGGEATPSEQGSANEQAGKRAVEAESASGDAPKRRVPRLS